MSIASRRPHQSLLALVGVGILVVVLYLIGSDAMLLALRRCHPVAIAIAAAAITSGSVLGAWNCYRIAELRGVMPFLRFLPIYWRSWAIGLTLPGQVGDFLATLWQLKGRTSSLETIAGRLMVDKAVTLGLTLCLAALLPALIAGTGPGFSLLLIATLCVSAALGLWLLDLLAAFDPTRAAEWTSRVRSTMAVARNTPRQLVVGNAIFTIIKLTLSGGSYWVVLRSIESATPGLLTTTAIAQSAGLIAYLPVSFNGLGTVEVSAVGLFQAVGLSSAGVLSAYLVLRATTLVAAWVPVAWTAMRGTAPTTR